MLDKRSQAPVFVHSSFRTSSTWLWVAFRKCRGARAYCEVFHETLASLMPSEVALFRYDAWASSHPATDPYFVEFAALLSPTGGIPGTSEADAFQSFMPRQGHGGELTASEHVRISLPIALAREHNMTPVLTCTRSLGRLGSIRAAYPGWHIFLYRNLYQQWLSYLWQFRNGNAYFLATISQTLDLNRHDPFINWLVLRYRPTVAPPNDALAGFATLDDALGAFVGLHVYLSMRAFLVADQVIDVNQVAIDRDYRMRVEATIRTRTDLDIDLSDARQNVEWVGPQLLPDPRRSEDALQWAAHVLEQPCTSSAYAFGQSLIVGFHAQADSYQLHARSREQPPALVPA